MAEIIMEVLGETAEFFEDSFSWRVPGNPIVQDMLNELLPEGGPAGDDPHYPRTVARAVQARYGGTIVEIVEQPAFDPNLIY